MPAANIESPAKAALGFIESAGLSITAVLADEAVKSAQVRLLGIETTGNERLMIRLLGQIGAIEAALAHVEMVAQRLGVTTVNTSLAGPDPALDALITYPNSQNPLYGGRDQMIPDAQETPHNLAMKNEALGILETQGLTAILEATDAMLKAANVTLVGKEKIGAAYVTVMVRGDVAAVTAAIDAGSRAVGSLGKLIAAHVIPRPHEDLIALLPKPKP